MDYMQHGRYMLEDHPAATAFRIHITEVELSSNLVRVSAPGKDRQDLAFLRLYLNRYLIIKQLAPPVQRSSMVTIKLS